MKLFFWIILLSVLLSILIPYCSEAFRVALSCSPSRAELLAGQDIWRLEKGVNLFDFGSKIPLITSWKNQIVGEQTIDDLVNLNDLAPTFLEFAHLKIPNDMTAKSLRSILFSDQSEHIESDRKFVVTARETHILCRKCRLGYPALSILTYDYLYIKKCEAERWPVGEPPLFGGVNALRLHDALPIKISSLRTFQS
jgi:N-sulfoglucosamine sulfohydrolase